MSSTGQTGGHLTGAPSPMRHGPRSRAAGDDYRQAVILVGGEGTRLRPITSLVPKPTVPLMGRPFITYILENLARHGVRRVVFSTGHLAAAIEAEVGDGSRFGLEARYAFEDSPLGTGGAIKNAQTELASGGFLVFNGDVLSDADLTAMVSFHRKKGGAATLLATDVQDARRYGLVTVGADGFITGFHEKPTGDRPRPGLINAGVYVFEQEVLDLIPAGQSSIERGVFPALADAGRLTGYVGRGYWRDIGTPQSYLEAHFDLLGGGIMLGRRHADSPLSVSADVRLEPGARIIPPVQVERGAVIGVNAVVGPWTVVGRDSWVGAGARVVASVLQEGIRVGRDAIVERSVIVRHASVGDGTQLSDVVIGESCHVGAGNHLANGLHLFPQAALPDHSLKFREVAGAWLAVPPHTSALEDDLAFTA